MNVLFLILLFSFSSAYAKDSERNRGLGVGINSGGGQLDWRRGEKWMLEARAQRGRDASGASQSRSSVFGLRAYRFYHPIGPLSPYLGAQGSYLEVTQSSGKYKASGSSLGAFCGMALRFNHHVSLGFDLGPYLISLKEKTMRVDQDGFEFVGDAALIYFF